MPFAHLHLHTQYSILDGLTNIKKLFQRAKELGMPAVAITDHGNMYGVKEFFKHANDKSNKDANGNFIVKPIVGCEVYVTRHYDHKLHDTDHKGYYHLILLAKNYEGYRNLSKIVSTSHIEGMYYKPRVSHEVIEKYHENLICSSACLAGEISRAIMAGNMEEAKKAVQWHKDVFGEDYYLEVMLHRTDVEGLAPEAYDRVMEVYRRQQQVNEGIFALAEEMGVKVIATNDVHFLMKEDGPVHDRLICLTTNSMVDDPKRLHYTQQEYLKSEEEMLALFPDHPEVVENTMDVVGKIDSFQIDRGHVLPKFNIDPDFLKDIDIYLEKYKDIIDVGRDDSKADRGLEFCKSVAYLCYLTYEGARIRYGDTLNEEQASRIEFELKTICKMGFPDYFLIVQDYIRASRNHGYMVGPGRGSAAGSVVAYCLWITNLDPIRYSLLFERFLNPDRISMPDIDVDFENLTDAHSYVEKQYGADHVSRVITFGTMAAKSAIKDVARISGISIDESTRLTKMVPDRLSEKVEKELPYDAQFDELKPGFKVVEHDGKTFQKGLVEEDVKITLKNCYRLVPEFINELSNGPQINRDVLKYAKELEGCIRQVGQHACATIIGRGNLTDYIPICLSKDKETGLDVWTSQYDGHYIEDVGMLKMDFLGLNTLSIIHETLDNVKANYGKDIDIEAIPIDDPDTYALYGRGDTTVVFQFESEGMKTWLQRLKPTRFEDLIAMNALYRPGPMDYIPDFVDRKLGLQKIEYDLAEMEEYLNDTYGVTVYQEQVMLLSQKLAGFTKGEADKLRKAMGKKQIAVMMELKDKFMKGGKDRGHDPKILDKIWKDWEKFAQYAFNKSHATCYAWVSYQTGYLKTHYTSEFFAANLSCNLDKMEEIKKIMADCKLHAINVLNPDVNESVNRFIATDRKNIRFGLGGMKGFGSTVVAAILKERDENGKFSDVWDFMERMSGQVNTKAMETLVYAGAFDSFGYKREQFFAPMPDGERFLDTLVHYADLFKNDQMNSATSLFGDVEELKPQRPLMPEFTGETDILAMLQKEKEYVGMYLSSHPLDRYAFEINNFTNCRLGEINDRVSAAEAARKSEKVAVAGIVTDVKQVTTRTGSAGTKVTLEDYSGTYELSLYGKDYESFMAFAKIHESLYIEAELTERYRLKPEERAQGKVPPYTFKPRKISLLCNVCQDHLDAFGLIIDSKLINPGFRSSLVKLLKKYKGSTALLIYLLDSPTGYKLDFRSKKFAVAVCEPFLMELSALGIAYQSLKK